jgi:ubiquinone/menaquinone biosynthesis C-methylase UbiE
MQITIVHKQNMKDIIKNYWEKHLPQTWYSNKELYSNEFFLDLEKKRYQKYYRYLKSVVEFDKFSGKKVIEIGCGIGTDLIQFARSGAIVTGIDLTDEAITITKKRFEFAELNAELMTADAENLPFGDNTFDCVYSFGVFHHTPDTQKAINEAYRVLKPGGKAIIMLYAKGLYYYVVQLFVKGVLKGDIFKMSLQECINKNSEKRGNCPLALRYKAHEALKLFKQYNNVTLKQYRMGPFLENLFPYFLIKLLEKKLGSNLIIKGYK